MKGVWLTAMAALLLVVAPVAAQPVQHEETPAACANASTELQYRACLEATPPGSGFHWLSLMHLGMLAMVRQDVAEAVRLFDQAAPSQGENFTRPRLHGYRAAAYRAVGRREDALSEAHVALSLLLRTRDLPDEAWSFIEDTQINNEAAYAAILPILRDARDPEYEWALAAYLALPVENWASAAMRAGALEALDRLEQALQFSERAMRMRPDHPLILNNHCYILVRLNRASEALPHCEKAVGMMPTSGAVRHSYASVLAAIGRCSEAAEQDAESRRLDAVSLRPEIACRSR
jgi:tetratricopeptide (TPR) repeat protein